MALQSLTCARMISTCGASRQVIHASLDSEQSKEKGCEKELEKLKKLHSDMIAKKNAMETKRREQTKTLFNSLDKIARDEVESLKADIADKNQSFEIPIIDFEEQASEK